MLILKHGEYKIKDKIEDDGDIIHIHFRDGEIFLTISEARDLLEDLIKVFVPN